MPNSLDYLASARVTGLIRGLQDPRLLPQPLVWNGRIPDVPAADDEIMASYQGQPMIADLIAEDAKAVIYSMGRFAFESTKIPKLKMGIGVTEAMLNVLDRISRNGGLRDDVGLFTNMLNRLMVQVRYGVELRKEVLKLAMLIDGYNYERLGIKLTNITWGMPSDLKITVGVAWTSTSATPITDIQTARRIARVRYAQELNRATMSTSALQFMAATTEFQTQARLLGFGLAGFPSPAIPLQNDAMIRQIAERLLGGGEGGAFTIEIDDRRYWTQDAAGAITSAPVQPINNVVLTNRGNDGNTNAYDFAHGVIQEGVVAGMAPANVVGGNVPQGFGPIAYATAANAELNPPGLVVWAVDRGFPRKFQKAASAVLNVGAITDVITVGVPFPL
jgi:hypothetical protein